MPSSARRPSKKIALQARDAGLRRIAIATRVLVVGSIAATGAFTALAAWAQPGRTKNGVRAPGQVAAGSSTSGTVGAVNGSGSGDGGNLAPPTTLPVPSYQYSSPAIVSGAS